jgi:hypothetical protein
LDKQKGQKEIKAEKIEKCGVKKETNKGKKEFNKGL